MVVDIFGSLPQELQAEIIHFAKQLSPKEASINYADRVGIKADSLYLRLRKILKNEGKEKSDGKTSTEKDLSRSEKQFLKDLESGKVGLQEASKLVAVRVFEKMLKNPDDVRFIDFFRAEMLRIKDTENKQKEKYANELLGRMFAGQLPPAVCPHCGTQLVKVEEIMEGEVVDESVSLAEDY